MFEYEINEVEFNGRYVNGEALEAITDFSRNTYIIKGSTGIGCTTALLNYTHGNCLIISPNVGMIESKKNGNYNSDKQCFIYSQSANNWDEVYTYLNNTEDDKQNIIINCTPDQIAVIKERKADLYKLLVNIPIFLDEFNAYTVQSEYRSVMGVFLELVWNEWIAHFKLSTATPNFKNIDVPQDKDVVFFKLTRADQEQKPIQITTKRNHVKQFVYDEVSKGRLVVVFSNNINIHKDFRDLRVANLTGKTLNTKLKPFKRGDVVEDLDYVDIDVLLLSSTYYAGFDIDRDCSICIVSDQLNDAFKISVNDAVQCYGRCRKSVHDALFVNIQMSNEYYPKSLNEINKAYELYQSTVSYYTTVAHGATYSYEVEGIEQITPQLYVNRGLLLEPCLYKIMDYQLYNDSVFRSTLQGYGFNVSDYEVEQPTSFRRIAGATFAERLRNLLELDSIELLKSYNRIKYNLKTKDNGSYNHKLCFEYLTAYILKTTRATVLIDKLNSTRVRPNEFYKSVNLYLRANTDTEYLFEQLTTQQLATAKRIYESVGSCDPIGSQIPTDWQYLYSCHKVSNNILPDVIEREIKLYEVFYNSDLYKPLVNDKSHRVRNVQNLITGNLIGLDIQLQLEEVNWLKTVSIKIFRELDETGEYVNHNTRTVIKNKMLNGLVFLLTNGKVGIKTETKNREYTPLTQLPKALRCIIPVKTIAVDLTSANPQIVNQILGTDIGLSVYQNLMRIRGISRNEAKTLYNATLNNHKLRVCDAKRFYIDCGYTTEQAEQLARLTANTEKGAFYEVMTLNEKKLMQNYQSILPVKSYRFHDAIIMPLELIEDNHLELPTEVNGYRYHVEIFNDSSDYKGLTTNLAVNEGVLIPNWHI
ncbi:hypothetical protein [Leeuwenhoekiella sp. LLG6367-2.1]|uniref:hypothetical protein n=1 Tax=Leeuwenhoekiella sp. LLG6367-2.1 TaxID=3160833 RepID=UPI003868F5D7